MAIDIVKDLALVHGANHAVAKVPLGMTTEEMGKAF